jgi:hypothetical protein
MEKAFGRKKAQKAQKRMPTVPGSSGKRRKMAKGELIIFCVPSLVSTLLNREKAKGSPLTEAEVLGIRDTAPAIAMPPDVAAKVEAERGYKDIDPENCWEEWQRARLELI